MAKIDNELVDKMKLMIGEDDSILVDGSALMVEGRESRTPWHREELQSPWLLIQRIYQSEDGQRFPTSFLQTYLHNAHAKIALPRLPAIVSTMASSPRV